MAIADINVEALSDGLTTGFHSLRLGEVCVPVRYHQGQSDTLVIIFHGAVDREKRETPRYQSFIPNMGPHHQISIPDPTLELGSEIPMAWYLGGADMPLQSQLPKIISAISAVAGIKRRIYLGGSSGGFASLYYSWADPKSACVTINPQVECPSL